MERTRPALVVLLASLMLAATPAADLVADPTFDSYWHDGKAELDGYQYTVTRYGQLRRGQCAAVYVTEPFSRAKRVKAEDPARNPMDTYDVLKLNLVRDFQTGIYDYNTMVSLFVRSEDLEPVKVSFASTEWCGNVYEELDVEPSRITEKLSSYFEDESVVQELKRPRDGILEEELFVRLRGLRGDFLRPGERRKVSFLPGAFHRRLTHQPIRWSTAVIERLPGTRTMSVPAGTFSAIVYVVKTAEGREGRIGIEREYPHRVVRWEWKRARGTGGRWAGDVGDSGNLAGSARLEYWKLNNEGAESYLKRLGLRPTIP